MLDNCGFDLWAESYDDSVKHAEENDQYPFAGYSRLMNAVYGTVRRHAPAKVLDVGFGTALLAKKLYDVGCEITGIDFSDEMIALAQPKMPKARLLQWDFTQGLPPAVAGETFDFIISTYALHHLAEGEQQDFVLALLQLLKPQGKLLIGDVCFPTEEALRQCRQACGDGWDDEENYFVYAKLWQQPEGFAASFHPFSFYSGVIEIART